MRANGLNQTPPKLNDQGRYSTTGGENGPNTVGLWTVIGIVNTGVQTYDDNTTTANTDYTYAVYMRDLAYNYSIGASKNASALPVQLTSFSGSEAETGVVLNWETATEINNYGFNVERASTLSKTWEKIGFVQGHGNSNSPKSYSFVDANASAGNVSYRLKQIDFDGKFEYSDVVNVNVKAPTLFFVKQNFPNPFNPVTVISYQLPTNSYVTLKVFDILGKEVATLVSENQTAGNHSVNFDGKDLPSGMYIYKVQAGNYSQIRKMLLVK